GDDTGMRTPNLTRKSGNIRGEIRMARKQGCAPFARFFAQGYLFLHATAEGRVGGTAIAVGSGSSRACKCRWAPYVRSHDLGQGPLRVSPIKAPGHLIPDAGGSTRPPMKLSVAEPCGNRFDSFGRLFQRLGSGCLTLISLSGDFRLRNRLSLLHLRFET